MASIYLIRHGQASFGTDDYDRLSDLGGRQAQVLGEYLDQCGIHFDAVYSGELLRQRRTAEIAVGPQSAPSVAVDARFNEINNEEQLTTLLPVVLERYPELEALVPSMGHSSKDYQKILKRVFNYWVSEECEEPAIQSWEEYAGNVQGALREVMRSQGSGKTIGIFTSGGTIATAVSQVLGIAGHGTYSFYEPVINCSVTRLFYSGERVSLSYFNDHSFLDLLGTRNGEKLVTYR
jgi:broad specificity phosphatase PhoE